jgi:hypothetical protein
MQISITAYNGRKFAVYSFPVAKTNLTGKRNVPGSVM